MASLFVSEFAIGVSPFGSYQAQMLPQPALADQVVDIGMQSAQSDAFGSDTHVVLLVADTACHVQFGADPTAAGTTMLIPANVPIPFGVAPGHKVAAIAAS